VPAYAAGQRHKLTLSARQDVEVSQHQDNAYADDDDSAHDLEQRAACFGRYTVHFVLSSVDK